MHHRNILITVLKIAAIMLFIQLVETVPEMYGQYLNTDDQLLRKSFINTAVFPTIVKVGIIFILWFFPSLLISSVVPDTELSENNPNYFKRIEVAALTGVGIYLLAYSVTDIAYYFVLKNELANQYAQSLQPQDKAAYYVSFLQAILGIVIIFGKTGIINVLNRIRR